METIDYQKILEHIFGEVSEETLSVLLSVGEQVHLEAGEYLFKECDTENSLYIVLQGRLRAFKGRQDILGDIAVGEPVG